MPKKEVHRGVIYMLSPDCKTGQVQTDAGDIVKFSENAFARSVRPKSPALDIHGIRNYLLGKKVQFALSDNPKVIAAKSMRLVKK